MWSVRRDDASGGESEMRWEVRRWDYDKFEVMARFQYKNHAERFCDLMLLLDAHDLDKGLYEWKVSEIPL